MKLKKGQILYIDNEKYSVLNMIEFVEHQEKTWIWQEYEIVNNLGKHKWLSIEEDENNIEEYYLYEYYFGKVDTSQSQFNSGNKSYELYEQGIETVKNYFGNADVDIYETCEYTDYICKSDDSIISIEKWDGEIEQTIGQEIEQSRIRFTEEIEKTSTASSYSSNFQGEGSNNKLKSFMPAILMIIIFLPLIFSLFSGLFVNKSVERYLEKSSSYTYVTSVTNNTNNKKAKVYKSSFSTIDATVKDIIDGVPEGIEKVTGDEETANNLGNTTTGSTINTDMDEEGVGLQTKDEYAYVYKEGTEIFVQASSKKYMNDSGTMYHSRHYHHYYRSYTSNRTIPVYTSYAYSARQSSINSRTSSGGGTSSGK